MNTHADHIMSEEDSVSNLHFRSGIPPWVHEEDVVGGGKVQGHSACFQRDEHCYDGRVFPEGRDGLTTTVEDVGGGRRYSLSG